MVLRKKNYIDNDLCINISPSESLYIYIILYIEREKVLLIHKTYYLLQFLFSNPELD